MDNSELYKLWDEFLVSWPVERVRNMTLDEYTEAGNQDAFIHWVEFKTKPLATISGTSSFIFGIYSRKDQSFKNNSMHHIYEDQYAWRSAYGKTKEEAFSHVKSETIKIIEAVQSNQLYLINDVDLFKTVKWKIAFLYQDRENIKIVPTFAEQRLRFLTGIEQKSKDFKIEDAYAKLLDEKGEKELFQYNAELNKKYLEANPKDKFNTQFAYDYIHGRYPSFEKTAEYLFVIENQFKAELALETTDFNKPAPRIFIKYKPPESIQGLKIEFKPNNKRSNSNLDSTKTLKNDGEFFKITISNMRQLESLCDWWDTFDGSAMVINDHHKKINGDNVKNNRPSLNRILFGAAGTGKTFNTINHALSILDPEYDPQLDRKELKRRFDAYKEQGRIKFVTFHQSFSYEDFVEGIRAETVNGNLTYDVKSGVFKELCDSAKPNIINNIIGTDFGRGYSLKSVSSKILEVRKPNGNLIHLSLDLANLLLKRVIEEKITIEDISQKKAIEKLEENNSLLEPFIVNGYCTVWANLIQLMLDNQNSNNSVGQPFILIIDEINRGNISRIFGELITLIEDSKRQDADEALSVTLPYSNEEFSVPNNVYIIGTMNSSDRSLTGLDIALRRRFTFIEMPPKPELLNDLEVEGLNIGELLKVINQRIEVLLDRDHCIGHANFMSLKKQQTLEHLATIFKQKIIPQLQEYFFDDWEKINLVLFNNKMLVEDDSLKMADLFPANLEQELGYSNEKKIWKINEGAFKTIDAFVSILGSQG